MTNDMLSHEWIIALNLLSNVTSIGIAFVLYAIYSQRVDRALKRIDDTDERRINLLKETEETHHRSVVGRLELIEFSIKEQVEMNREFSGSIDKLRDISQRLTTLQEMIDKRICRLEEFWMKDDGKSGK